MAAAEHVERQVAVAAVVAVEEPPFLLTVDWIVGGIEIEHDLFGRLSVRLQEDIDQQRLDRLGHMADLAIPIPAAHRSMLQPVQRRLPGQRRTAPLTPFQSTQRRRQRRIVPKIVVVVDVLVAQRNPHNPLAHQPLERVLDARRRTAIDEAPREPPH